MFSRGNHRAAIAAMLLYLLLIPDASYPQDRCPGTGLAASASTVNLQYDSAFCAQNEEPAPLAQRILLARESCESPPRAGLPNGICARNRAAASVCTNEEDRVQMQLLALGRRGETIARIRQQILEILQNRNACSAWYQGVDADPAATFQSLVFVLDQKGSPFVYSLRDDQDARHFKHPYVASAIENAGRNSAIQLNVNGAFFNRSSSVLEEPWMAGPLALWACARSGWIPTPAPLPRRSSQPCSTNSRTSLAASPRIPIPWMDSRSETPPRSCTTAGRRYRPWRGRSLTKFSRSFSGWQSRVKRFRGC